MSTVEHLEKVLGDLVSNRGRLVEQINAQRLQLEVNETQIEHFDTLIATVRNTLGDAAAISKVDELRISPPQDEASNAPLGFAGADSANASAPAEFNGQGLPSQG